MSFADSEFTLHSDVEIRKVGEAAFANTAFFGADDPGDGAGGPHDGLLGLVRDLRIHDVTEGEAQHGVGAIEDDHAGKEGSPVVGDLETFPPDKADGDADKGGDRGDGVRTVMPGVGQQGVAPDAAGLAGHNPEEQLLQTDDDYKQKEGPGGGEVDDGAVCGGDKLADAVMGNESAGHREDEGTHDGGKGLGLSVTVRVLRISGLGRILEGTPDQERAEEVEQGLDPVCDQGIGSTDQASGDLPGGEDEIQKNPCQDSTPPLSGLQLEITVGHGEKLKGEKVKGGVQTWNS